MPAGRPTDYTPELAAEICGRLGAGQSVKAICAEDGMPAQSAIYRWIAMHPEFKEMYTQARVDSVDALADDALAIADDSDGDVQRDRLRVETRKWFASKMQPRKYGDAVKLTGDPEAPVVALWKVAEQPKT